MHTNDETARDASVSGREATGRHEAVPSAASAAPGLSRGHRTAALFTILCMTFMETLDGTIVNVALPTMQTELGVDMAQIQWVASIFLVTTCAFLLIFGRLGDMIGKVRVFQAGVALFTIGSALCALSATLPALVLARAVQALGVAASLANNQGIISEIFANSRGRALGLVATFTALGAMTGPTLGGALVSVFPWEAIFLINIPIGILSFLLGLKVLPNQKPAKAAHFDIKGAVLIVPAILLIFIAITLMENGATPALLAALAAGVALLALFVAVERRASDPLVRMEVFGNVNFDIDLVAMVLVFLGLSGVTIIMPFYLQQALGLDPALAGLIMACYPLVNAIVGPVSGAASDRIGCEKPTIAGQVIFACGLTVLSALTLDTPIPGIVASLMFTSLGSAMFQAPNNSLIMGHADADMLGFVGSLGNLMRYLGQSLGITVAMGVLYGSMSDAAGMRVTSYVEGRPDIFMAGLSVVFHVLAALVLIGLALSLLRTFVLGRKKR